MELLAKVLCVLVLLQPALADTGDTLAYAFGFVVFGVLLCAGVGAYARKYDSAFKQ